MKFLNLMLWIFDIKIFWEAKWMWWFKMRRFLSHKNKGLIFSRKFRLPLNESYKNLALVAPTWSGKTTRYVIPNILLCSWSVVVTDPSGEIYKSTSQHMEKRGYKVQVFNPVDWKHSLKFNPMDRFKTSQEIKQLATILWNQNVGLDSDPFWKTWAINILYIMLMSLRGVREQQKHIWTVRKLLNSFWVSWEGVKDFMIKNLDETVFWEFKSFISKDSKTISWFLSSASVAIELWSDQNVVDLTSHNTISIEALRKEKTIIYLIVPEHLVKYFSIIINLFYSACFEYCIKEITWNPVFFFLDEFWNLWKINNFASIATTLRKRRCSINIILQELSQLTAIYGYHEAKSIFSWWMANKLFFSWLDLETCTYLEKVLWKETAQEIVGDEASKHWRTITVGKSLMSVDQIRMMWKDEAILISGSELPIKLIMPKFFEDRKLRKLCYPIKSSTKNV